MIDNEVLKLSQYSERLLIQLNFKGVLFAAHSARLTRLHKSSDKLTSDRSAWYTIFA